MTPSQGFQGLAGTGDLGVTSPSDVFVCAICGEAMCDGHLVTSPSAPEFEGEWYSGPQIEEMKVGGVLPCKCGNIPTLSDDNCRPDDGWRTLWCQPCMEHVADWKPSATEVIRDWNAQRERELSHPLTTVGATPSGEQP